MEQNALVSEICDEAENFLEGVTNRTEAKADIAEWLTVQYPKLNPDEMRVIVAQSMAILENEGFFEIDAGNDT